MMITLKNKFFIILNFVAILLSVAVTLFNYLIVHNRTLFDLITTNIFFLFSSIFFTFLISKIERQIRTYIMFFALIVLCIILVFCVIQSVKQNTIDVGFIVFNYLSANIIYRLFFDPEFGK